MDFKLADRTTGTYLIELERIREEAEALMVMGSGFPDEFVSVLCMRNAALSQNPTSLALASIRETLAFREVASQMRRLPGPRGCAPGQGVLAAANLDAASEEKDFAFR